MSNQTGKRVRRGRPPGSLGTPTGPGPIKTLIELPLEAHRRGRALAHLMGVPISSVFEKAINHYFQDQFPRLAGKPEQAA